ncbi:uncharacterized protein LOC124202217 [Daphnia pulex]|uniref:uncharacterized protein LOC124202217 n=1 Tax=Daphnia pulex TaxID=6669 RepID=UPI001EE03AAA|nr:uncharacterized protein LOC124202217 [Daphnia pulex]XP_046454472.1 uncharacterized protein LOC124202217 [Daphnia pulex]XP_046454473.1 uncharacterized protein LOC124202217 [Daphnia pulex]
MSGNNFPTGQSPYSINWPFGYASDGSTNLFNCMNNQAAEYWPNYQFQPFQPPLPQFPPPQQPPPPPPSFPPQENWPNGYSNQQQGSISGLTTYQTGNNMMPYYFSQYQPQPTYQPAFSTFNQVTQGGFYVDDHNAAGSKKVKAQQGEIKHMPKISWNIVSASVTGTTGEINSKEDVINNGGVESSAIETVACKMSSSKVDTTHVEVASTNGDGDENGVESIINKILAGDKVGRIFCAYCKTSGHKARSCPIKPCFICDKTGHRPKNCPEKRNTSGYERRKRSGKKLVTSNKTATHTHVDWRKLTSQSTIPLCATGANAIPRGNERPMSVNKQSAQSPLISTASIVDDSNLYIPLSEIQRSKASKQDSAEDGCSSPPFRKTRRSCYSFSIEKNVYEKCVPLDSTIKGLPRKELERIIMAYDGMMADMEEELNHSKERADTLEREVISLRVKSERRQSVGEHVDELTNDVTADRQISSDTSEPTAVKIERIEGTNKDRPKEIPRSPSATVPCIFEMPTANINKNKVVVKTEKL